MFFERAKPTLIIDCHGILHSLRHAGKKYYSGGEDNGLITQFFITLKHLADTLYTDRFIFAWDSPVNKRKQKYSWYKSNRERKDETPLEQEYFANCMRQFPILRDTILPTLGYQCFMVEGYEADDIIASIVMNNKEQYIFVTSDADMYQLLPYARMYDFKHKQVLTKEWFKETCGFPADDWWKVKMIAGCSTDTVPGVEGVGEKTAIEYLNGKLLPKYKKYQAIKHADPAMLTRNESLVRLPLEGCPILQPTRPIQPRFDTFQHLAWKHNLFYFQSHANLQNIKQSLGMV